MITPDQPFGACSDCGDLLTEEESVKGVCQNCIDEFNKEDDD